MPFGLVAVAGVTVALGYAWRRTREGHDRRIGELDVRIHVNGIRGKSSVTRLVAAVLREGGFVTVAKTTGSAARVIGAAGEEIPILRRGAATVNEQVEIVSRYVTPDVQALVIECMAVNPIYQRYAQDRIVKSDITIITNVREDHQEVMGETLEEIADSMSETIPRNGVLVTAEDRPRLRDRLAANAARRECAFEYADPETVSDEEMSGFGHLEFKANVAIALRLAQLLGIDRDVAMRGMWKAVPDVGAVHLQRYAVRGKDLLWVPLFAANDRESVIAIFESLSASHLRDHFVVGVLNNRWDRGRRAELFAEMVPRDLARFLDHVVTFGAYEIVVTTQMKGFGYPADQITNLGETVNPSLDAILDAIAGLTPAPRIALIGLVNIHTPQAEMLLEHFAAEDHAGAAADRSAVAEDQHVPLAVVRHRNATRRHLTRRVRSEDA
ncbi:MAG: poly-gamma-glutamate synthase PgsB [Candidatus Limnocylindrales bacterium]